MLKLNLGSGGHKLEGYVNVDQNPLETPDVVFDLSGDQPWPWEDNSVDEAVASHVIEHLTTKQFFRFMQELYRVCKPNATVTIALPHPRHDIFLADPTHQRPVTPTTMVLFSKQYIEAMAKKGAFLTPFYKYLGVDFELQKMSYKFDQQYVEATGKTPEELSEDPQVLWDIKHLNNVVMEWKGALVVRK